MDNAQATNGIIDEQDLDNQLDNLLKEATKINQEAEEARIKNEKEMDEIESGIDGSIANIKQIHAELDKAEEDAGDELDALVLQQIEDLSAEEKDEE